MSRLSCRSISVRVNVQLLIYWLVVQSDNTFCCLGSQLVICLLDLDGQCDSPANYHWPHHCVFMFSYRSCCWCALCFTYALVCTIMLGVWFLEHDDAPLRSSLGRRNFIWLKPRLHVKAHRWLPQLQLKVSKKRALYICFLKTWLRTTTPIVLTL